MEGRRRRSRGSSEVQTAQWQPMVGTPTLVPEPSTVMRTESNGILGAALPFRGFFGLFVGFHEVAGAASFRGLGGWRRRFFRVLLHRLDVAEAQLGQGIFDEALLFHRGVTAGLVPEHAEQIDGMARDPEVGFGAVLFAGKKKTKVH